MGVARSFAPSCLAVVCFSFFASPLSAQQPSPSTPKDYSQESSVIEQFSSQLKFENDGTYTSETTIRVRIQSASGVQDWGLVQLPYPSSMGDAEIANVKVTKPDGTMVATPPETAQDMPAQITVAAPSYSDLKVKQLAVKGLDAGDVLEYRMIFNARSPLIPGQFWYSRDFFKGGIVLNEQLQISIPRDRSIKMKSANVQPTVTEAGGYRVYLWKTSNLLTKAEIDKAAKEKPAASDTPFADVQLSTFQTWDEVAQWYRQLEEPRVAPTPEIRAKADELTRGAASDHAKIHALYDFVAIKFRYIGVSFGIGRYQPHSAAEVLANGYGDCKDKHTLLASLLAAAGIKAYPALINSTRKVDSDVPAPSQFDHVITAIPGDKDLLWLDTTPEVAPFAMLMAPLRDNRALLVADNGPAQLVNTPADTPFPQSFSFQIAGKMSSDGTLDAKVNFSTRGDAEVVMRSALRSTSQAQWKDVMQAVSQAWGFSGDVSDVTASSPEATENPLTLNYAYNRKSYPNWPDVLQPPLPSRLLDPLPDDADKSSGPVLIDSPVEYLMDAKVELPPNIASKSRPPVDITRDFAEYHATYTVDSNVAHAQRRLIIHMKEIPRARLGEYRDFLKAVTDDADRVFSLSASATSSSPASPTATAGPASTALSADARTDQLIDLGNTLFKQNDLDAAIAEYRKALELRPDSSIAHHDLGNALGKKNDLDGAMGEYREAIRFNPNFAEAHVDLADALSKKNDWDGAITEYREAIRVKPDVADTHYYLAYALVNKADLNAAAAEYREAIRLQPNYPAAHDGVASILIKQGHADQAADEMRKALADDPQFVHGYLTLGVADVLLHRDDDALAAWKQAEKLDPDLPGAPFNIGKLLISLNRFSDAVAELRPAVEKNPKDSALAFLLGRAALRSGDVDGGVAAFKKSLELDSSPASLNGVAYELADGNAALDDALTFAQKAVQQQEDATSGISLATLSMADLRSAQSLPSYWDTLGWAQFRLGHMDEAEKFLLAAWKSGQFGDIGDHLGQFYQKSGNRQQAIRYYSLAITAGRAPAETTVRLAGLADNKTQAGAGATAGEDLSAMRTAKLPRLVKGQARAEFFVIIAPGAGITDTKFISGSQELRDQGAALSSAHFDIAFPDDHPVKIVRRGFLDSPTASPSCQFILLPVESVSSLN